MNMNHTKISLSTAVEIAYTFIAQCWLDARSDATRSIIEPVPSTISRPDILIDLLIILAKTTESKCLEQMHPYVCNEVFSYAFQLFNKFYTPSQYPCIYGRIVLQYVLYSHNIDYKEKATLIDDSFNISISSTLPNLITIIMNGNGLRSILWELTVVVIPQQEKQHLCEMRVIRDILSNV